MTAINHALTGALIASLIHEPLAAVPLAFASHFVCDVIPHYDVPGTGAVEIISSRQFLVQQIIGGGALCLALVASLVLIHPAHWLLMCICAFAAAVPDAFYIPRFLHIKRTGKDNLMSSWFWWFHDKIQWFQKPIGGVVELAWAAGAITLLVASVR